MRSLDDLDHSTPTRPAEEAPVTIELDQLDPTRPSRRPKRTWWLAAAAAVVVALGAIATAFIVDDDGPGTAATDTAQRSVRPANELSFDVLWPDLTVAAGRDLCVDAEQTYMSASRGECVATWSGEAVVTGDVGGTALWVMHAGTGRSDDDDATMTLVRGFSATYVVQATIDGCGSGEFMMTDSLGFVGWEAGGFVGAWEIVPGSGRDGLAGISGSGQVVAQASDGNGPAAARTHEGTVSC